MELDNALAKRKKAGFVEKVLGKINPNVEEKQLRAVHRFLDMEAYPCLF